MGETVEKKSDELLEMIDEEVENGLFRLDEVNERVGSKVDELKKDLGDILSSEQRPIKIQRDFVKKPAPP